MNVFLTITILLSGIAYSNSTGTVQKYTGTATDLKTGDVIYYEEHEAKYDDGRHVRSKITYRDPLNNIIAEKNIEMSGTAFAEFRLEDFRYGTVEGAEQSGSRIKLYQRENKNSRLNEKIVSIPQPTAIDAGLNVMVRNNWEKLQQGEKVSFNLGVPSQLDYFEFRVVKAGKEEYLGKRTLVVRFESDHWYIRLFVDPVVVWYDLESRRAVRYEGISNIYNEQGKSYVVRVTFDKPGP